MNKKKKELTRAEVDAKIALKRLSHEEKNMKKA